ncbi:MAG TPA: LLM class flavin-dependent oxidoreductase [Gordonia sp. (in: high G+C Gram-positive bacteria)]|uniref:LLM class flavin-dependent oxidoreductase n=1 Tax=unclassified Gordonia (in: high G+C Gram-positive bacteria) TaxID=2657482 RepID=UPI000FA55098|nr:MULTISPECIES: LLM class flavin-dependent oxidoreductase [unclassified Gordonia (in: high G+C Gram-positive bacteria)]RUP37147.1 MAG: LLM class flavin-dependent oxidoreductase [Gordonia sp. (in: high G+C Gram-positive bacteria)]HNP57869.1 LLM class flavin-dependent oxidoreductase [Gordonia sp. (in: high G+C Gram-positive bacteria)]HRC51538.1 LLM class flavin-dependent oxidoreductase [Gordonia sp. (in: high G+C Gram-positive bacteria)]
MKKIGFLSFGHWSQGRGSHVRSGADALLQSVDLAVAAEELGADGAYFRVHHFAQQLGSPFPLLAAIGAKTDRIEIGTGVIDMRYENPLYMAEDAGAADLLAGGRLQLGISRGSPEQVIEGYKYFGHVPDEDSSDADMAREHAAVFLTAIEGTRFAEPNPRPMFPNPPGLLGIEPQSPGLRDRIWWGAGTRATAEWTARHGMNLMSSTLLTEDTGVPFHQLQAEQIQRFRDAWREAGHDREPRVSVSRSIFALVNDLDHAYFGMRGDDTDQVGIIDNSTARFGRSYAAEPDKLIEELREDEAIAAADTLLLTVPNQLGVDYNAHVIESILTHVAPALGWR